MTPERKEEIKGRRNAIGESPWQMVEQHRSGNQGKDYEVRRHSDWSAVTGWGSVQQTKEDAEFISHAPEDVDFMLAALEEAQQEIKEWQEEAKQWRDDFVEKNNELAEAQQTIALKQSSIEVLAAQVVDETALHANTEVKLIMAERTIARQRKALEFYATQSNHKWSHTYDETGEVEEIPSKVANDRGKIAREALEEGETQP